MNNIPRRRERRAVMRYQGVLRKKSKLSFSEWLEFTISSIKNGTEIFNVKKEETEKLIAEQLEQKELSLIEFWKSLGYNQNEIEKLREANSIFMIRFLPTWKEDKKVARRLINEVNKSKAERLND